MIHPNTELSFISKEIGYGVVATKLIPKGTITWAMDKFDRVFTPNEFAGYETVYQDILNKYSFRNNEGNLVFCWDIARFVNHSFRSNCISTAYDFELAIRDIQPGEELTDDYGFLNLSEPFDCLPEAGSNRTRVMPDDLLNFYPEWDELLKGAFKHFNAVKQPLKSFIHPQFRAKVENVANGKTTMDSILQCYYAEKSKVA